MTRRKEPDVRSHEIAVFDIDGTLADVSERLHHVRGRRRDWDAFFAGMAQDRAIRAIVRLANLLHGAGVRIVLCSGRPERYRQVTVEWLKREGVRYDELRLRRDGDRRADTVAKREMLADLDPSEVLFVVEDRASVVEMWRKEGFVCLQSRRGNSERRARPCALTPAPLPLRGRGEPAHASRASLEVATDRETR